MKRILALILLLVAKPVWGAGTIPLSLTQQFDNQTGKILTGGKLFTIKAGTVATPQNCFKDSALTQAHPNPIVLDAGGRIPQLFCADGVIKVRLTNASGVNQIDADNVQVIGSSGGGGGGGAIDPTTILQTGDVKYRYGSGSLSGYVRGNARTIGSSSSGATERANADCQSLFEYLWNSDANLEVSSGRGASANADWTANKTIKLPDFRTYALVGLGGMGNTISSGMNGVTFNTGSVDVLGSTAGVARRSLATANLPSQAIVDAPVVITDPGHTHPFDVSGSGQLAQAVFFGTNPPARHSNGSAGIATINTSGASTGISAKFSWPFTGQNATPFDNVQPSHFVTIYIKL